jgi:hypothetical protein
MATRDVVAISGLFPVESKSHRLKLRRGIAFGFRGTAIASDLWSDVKLATNAKSIDRLTEAVKVVKEVKKFVQRILPGDMKLRNKDLIFCGHR